METNRRVKIFKKLDHDQDHGQTTNSNPAKVDFTSHHSVNVVEMLMKFLLSDVSAQFTLFESKRTN